MKYLKYLLWTLLASVLILQGYFFIQILLWRWVNPETTAFQRAELQRLCSTSKICALKKDWIPLKEISPTLRRAVMISEDSDFYRHHGFELKAMKEAWQRNQQKGKHLRGGSTITQQLAKNLFLSGEKNYIRKGQEFIITGMLELLLSKDRIFEIYLNHVEWGEGIFGIAAASRHYYALSPKQLGIQESAALAAALPAPKCFDQQRYCAKARINFPNRIEFILEWLARQNQKNAAPVELDERILIEEESEN